MQKILKVKKNGLNKSKFLQGFPWKFREIKGYFVQTHKLEMGESKNQKMCFYCDFVAKIIFN